MFGISGFELLVIIAFVLLIFGPDKLPDLARTFGKAWQQFKRVESDMERLVRAEVYAPGKGVESVAASARAGSAPAPTEEEAAATTARAGAIWAETDEGQDEEEDEE